MWLEEIALLDIAIVVAASVGAVGFAGLTLGWLSGQSNKNASRPERHAVSFLFNNGTLVDASPSAQRLFDVAPAGASDVERLCRVLAPRFPEALGALTQVNGAKQHEFWSTDRSSKLDVINTSDTLRVDLTRFDAAEDSGAHDIQDCLTGELLMQRHLLENVELPMWRQTDDGVVTWSNAAFQRLAEAVADPSKSLQRQFDPAADKRRVQRAEVHVPNEAESRWYEFRIADLDGDHLITAIPVDRVVRAEKSLGAFVQTLTQTFAHLNVGLAVFSRTRELAVFNPALTELLDLSPEFLVTRPSLHHMFERMREQRMVPEPKNNTSWRQRMADIEAAASDTELSETWSLVDGRTLRVTGRPHPEGAIALLFEDISNEISLERRFRAELQLGHAVIDGLDEALAVFSPSGALVISNRAYNRLWHNGLMAKDAAPNFIEATRIWQHHCHPTPVWGDARDFVATIGERTNWTADVHMASGKSLACRFDTLTGGFTLAGFTERATRAHTRPAARLSA